MLLYAKWKMPLAWLFQHDNDPCGHGQLKKVYLKWNGNLN